MSTAGLLLASTGNNRYTSTASPPTHTHSRDRHTDLQRTDGWRDRETNGQKERPTNNNNNKKNEHRMDGHAERTDRNTDGRTGLRARHADRPTDK